MDYFWFVKKNPKHNNLNNKDYQFCKLNHEFGPPSFIPGQKDAPDGEDHRDVAMEIWKVRLLTASLGIWWSLAMSWIRNAGECL
jgi:hypothetical protein